ncbi:RTX toxin [Pseudomonas syringae pv. avellanae str. ISPaVe013]|nr:RTX toxin [Pseudomonas syringae pv. avellanae str. ISPaVe013]
MLHLLSGLDGADDRVGHGQGKTGLLEQRFAFALAAVTCLDDIDGLPGDVDAAFRRANLAAHLAVAFARLDQHIALGRAHRTRRCGLAGGEVLDALLLSAERQCNAATAEQAAFLHRLVVTFAAALGRGFDVDVVVSRQNGLVSRHHVAAADVNVATGLDIGLLATQRRALRLGLVDSVTCGGGLAGEQTVAALELVRLVCKLGVLRSNEVHVAPGVGNDRTLLAGDTRASGVDVLRCAQANVALPLNGRADFGLTGILAPVAAVPVNRLLMGFADSRQVDVIASLQRCGAASACVDHLSAGQVKVFARVDVHGAASAANEQPGHSRQVGTSALSATAITTAGDDIDVLTGIDSQAVCSADQPTKIVEVFPSGQRDLVSLDATTEVFDVLRGNRHHTAPGQATAVDQVACDVQVQALSGNQRARAVEVAFLHAHVDLRHQHVACFAIGEGDFLLHQPDDIAGQLRHLLGGQLDARHQLPLIGEGHSVVDQRPVLGFVIRIAIKEASTGELRDLFANQLLLVETVTEALLGQGRVDLQALKHVIRRQPGTVTGKARIGFDQVAAAGLRVGGKQTVIRQLKRRATGANLFGDALGVLRSLRSDLHDRGDLKGSGRWRIHRTGGRNLLADCLGPARADLRAGASDGRVLCEDSWLQGYLLDQRRRSVSRRIRALPVATLALDTIEVGHRPAVDRSALAGQFGVGQAGNVRLQ